jgi:hypothetical protein
MGFKQFPISVALTASRFEETLRLLEQNDLYQPYELVESLTLES